MNAFERLLNFSDSEKAEKGVLHTPAEIAQQPETWAKTLVMLHDRRDDILSFMISSGLVGDREAVLVLTGAGSSEFVGTAVCSILRRALNREVMSVPTTHLVTHPRAALVPWHSYVIVSFARSGNSPESIATFDFIRKVQPSARHMVITCNRDGGLAQRAGNDPESFLIVLPDETNDRSLVMTSSFSTMAFTAAGVAHIRSLVKFGKVSEKIQRAARRITGEYGDLLSDFARKDFSRACFLGSDTLWGTMEECQLKLLEMTEGRIAARFDSYLGLRHGPRVFVNDDCVVVAALSSDPVVRRYEMDLLRELKHKRQGCGTLVVCDHATKEISEVATHIIELFPDEEPVEDCFRVMTDVVVGQVLATFKSLDLGLKPDNPSTTGVINRVVQGVVIYDTQELP